MKDYKIKLDIQDFVIKDETKKTNVKIITSKGDKGDTGDTGPAGPAGVAGQDGYTPVKGVDYFTEEDIDELHIPRKVSQLQNDSGYITGYTETDPIFNSSVAKNITSNDITNWNNKSNFSGNYDDLNNKPTLFSGNYNDLSNKPTIPSKTSDLTNNSGFIDNSVDNLTNYTKTSNLSNVATSGSYNDLSNKPTIPTNVSQLTNDSGYITTETDPVYSQSVASSITSNDITNWNNKSTFSGNYNDLSNKPTIPTQTSQLTNNSGFIDKTVDDLNNYTKTSSLSTVATSGDYNDLSNKPTIPEKYDYIIPTLYIETSYDTPSISGVIESQNIIEVLNNIFSNRDLNKKIGIHLYDERDGDGYFLDNTQVDRNNIIFNFKNVQDETYILQIRSNGASPATYQYKCERIEEVKNKVTSITSNNKTSTSDYPSNKAIVDYISDNTSPKMSILKYGISTWQDFINAYNDNAVVYCRASSNANPASGSQTRLAFMAYVNDGTSPTQVEFQYYRSVSSHSASQQGDQVFVYLLKNTNGGTWSVTTREASTKIVVGSGLTSSYSNGVLTISLS